MVATAVVGSTGLIGSQILQTLLASPLPTSVSAFTRKELNVEDPHSRLRPIISKDSSTWIDSFSTIDPKPAIFFSGLGTTRGIAGGFENQRKIDYDLNLDLAKAAQANGTKVYVLISSAGSTSKSMLGYPKMKGELEDAVSALDFEKVVIVRPGLIVGKRQDSRPPEAVFRYIASGLGAVSGGRLKDFWAQDDVVIGKAAVKAGLMAVQGDPGAPKEKVWRLEQKDIIRLGKE